MINWQKIPFIRILIPFLIGIVFGYNVFAFDVSLLLLAFAVFFISLVILNTKVKSQRRIYYYGVILNLALFSFGVLITTFHSYINVEDDDVSIHSKIMICKVIEPAKEKSKSCQVVAEVINVLDDLNKCNVSHNILLYIEKDSLSSGISLGDELLVSTRLNRIEAPKNPGEFDYRKYLLQKGIGYQAYIQHYQWQSITTNNYSLKSVASEYQKYLLKLLSKNGLKDEQLAIASALILGSKEKLDYETKQSFATAGAMHVLAVSGLHVGIIYLILNTLFSFMNKLPKGLLIKALILLLSLWIYALLTGLSPSVLRATTMFSFVILGASMKRQSNIYNTLAISAFVLLLFDPKLIFEVGFQLSYVAVVGIVYLQPKIYKWLNIKWWFLDKVWAITAVSISAQIATLPLTLYYFNQFPTYFMLSNLIVIPAAVVILCLGILTLVTSFIPPVSETIGWCLNEFIYLLNSGVNTIEKLPGALIEGVSISVIECFVLYIMIILVVFGLYAKKVKFINYSMVCIIVLLLIDIKEDYQINNSNSIVVYHLKSNQAIDFIKGNENVLLADSAILLSEQKLKFHIKPNWYNHDLSNSVIFDINKEIDTVLLDNKLSIVNNISCFENKKLYRIEPGFKIVDLAKKIELDYLLISNDATIELRDLYRTFNFGAVVIDGSNSKWNRNRVEQEALESHIKLFNTDDGAFIANL